MRFSYELLILSYKHRLYLIHDALSVLGLAISVHLNLPSSREVVVEHPTVHEFAADCPFCKKGLGFNHAPYNRFFLLS